MDKKKYVVMKTNLIFVKKCEQYLMNHLIRSCWTFIVKKISQLAHSNGLLCLHDWGSGSFYKFKQHGLRDYFTVQQELSAGPDMLTFSGDKILGGVQAGILLGKSELIKKMRESKTNYQ